MNFHLITHTDLDGAGCAILLKRHCDVEVSYVGYPTIDQVIRNFIYRDDFQRMNSNLWITDISPSEEVAREIDLLYNDKRLMIQVVDHHATSSYLKPFPWAVHDTEACGTKLVHQHMKKILGKSSASEEVDDFVEAIDAYDRWLLEHPLRAKGEDLNRLLYFYGRDDFVDKFSEDIMLSELESRRILKYLRKNEEKKIEDGAKAYISRVDSEGRRFGMTLAVDKPNETAERILERDPNICYVVIPNALHGKVELRAKGKVDVSEIAKKLGGGGHPNAAGFQYDTKKVLFDTIVKVVQSI